MIKFYYNTGPNPMKVALFLEEAGLAYEPIPVDGRKGDQHQDWYRAINPNGKAPAIVDTEGAGGEVTVFDSNAILLYLSEKTGQFGGSPADRGQLLSWLMFVATGIGPYSGQSVHFGLMAPEKLPYAINRYKRETERHYEVLDQQLQGHEHVAGDDYTIVDMAAWGWVDRAKLALQAPEGSHPLDPFPNLKRWFVAIDARPAAAKARKVGADHAFKQEMDEDAKRAMFPSNYATS